MFLIWLVPCAVARNIQTMLVARFLDGVAGSAFLSVAGGTIGDMFDRSELQAPMMVGLTFAGLLVGIVIAVASDPLWHRNYVRLVHNRELNGGEKGGAEPEYRLPPAIAGGILVPIGLFCVPPSGLPMGYYIARLPNGGDGPVPVSGLRWTGPVLDDGRNVANSAPGTSSSGTGKEYEG
ncbi:MAG: hypothetical protein Q9211_001505 [Gyalolechia sp. 1 TL-2023]